MNKRKKGKNLLDTPKDYTVVDIETTGLDFKIDSIIELSALKVRDDVVVGEFTSLVKPDDVIDDFIARLTGITNEMLSNAPAINDVLPGFLNFVSDDILIGHNVNFDINFIYDSVKSIYNKHFDNNFIDTMRLSRRCIPGLKHYRLIDIMEHFGVKSDTHHRGLADCKSTFECFNQLKSLVLDKNINLSESVCGDLKASDIKTTNTQFDEDSPFYGKLFVFTGTLEALSRRQAMQIVVDNGGQVGDGVTKKTNYLVLGNNDYCQSIKDGKSSKQKKAEDLILKGQDLKVISENVFYDMMTDIE